MKLYFSPMAGSLAVRIALYEAGLEAAFLEVPRRTKVLRDGSDYREIHPLGLVPLLELDDGQRLTELTAILGYLAELRPATPGPRDDALSRARLIESLAFIATELHKGLFFPLFDLSSTEAARAYACAKGESRLVRLSERLEGREWLFEGFSVADAYLVTVLSWFIATPLDLAKWPVLKAYLRRGLTRPQVARAMADEKERYVQALASGGDAVPTAR